MSKGSKSDSESAEAWLTIWPSCFRVHAVGLATSSEVEKYVHAIGCPYYTQVPITKDRNSGLQGSLAGVLQGLHLVFDIHKICAVGSRVGLLQFANISIGIL